MTRTRTRGRKVAPKQTTGGKFDASAGLLYFIAGGAESLKTSGHDNVLIAVNEVRTRKDLALVDKLCDTRNVLMDSGVFSLAMSHAKRHRVSHDVGLSMPPEEIDGFPELWDRYASVVTRFRDRLWGVIELDQGGVANKPRTRKRIEDELGVTPMPVYHPLLDGWDYYDDLAAGYDRICFANLVKAAPPIRLRLIHTASERARGYPHLWTHLLGVYPNENLLAMPLRGSCDSSSWLTSLRWMPSWKAWSMAKMVSPYPPAMWYPTSHTAAKTVKRGETARDYYRKAEAMNASTARSLQTTIDALREDTHPWL